MLIFIKSYFKQKRRKTNSIVFAIIRKKQYTRKKKKIVGKSKRIMHVKRLTSYKLLRKQLLTE